MSITPLSLEPVKQTRWSSWRSKRSSSHRTATSKYRLPTPDDDLPRRQLVDRPANSYPSGFSLTPTVAVGYMCSITEAAVVFLDFLYLNDTSYAHRISTYTTECLSKQELAKADTLCAEQFTVLLTLIYAPSTLGLTIIIGLYALRRVNVAARKLVVIQNELARRFRGYDGVVELAERVRESLERRKPTGMGWSLPEALVPSIGDKVGWDTESSVSTSEEDSVSTQSMCRVEIAPSSLERIRIG